MREIFEYLIAIFCLIGLLLMWSVLKDPEGYSLSARIGIKLLKAIGLI
ncbi:MAG: hypothetical protein QXT86_08765 [Archaeoglobaceae archaeon]